MAQYGSNAVLLEITDSGATSRHIEAYVRTFNGISIEALLEVGHGFGDAWQKSIAVGVKKGADIVLGGFFDDTAAVGPDALLNVIGATRVFKATWGGTKTSSFSVVIKLYKRLPVLDQLVKFESTLTPSGAITET